MNLLLFSFFRFKFCVALGPLARKCLFDLREENVKELCLTAQGAASLREGVLAKNAAFTYEQGMALLRGESVTPFPDKDEGTRILAAQKRMVNEASKLYTEMSERAAKKLYAFETKIGEGGYGKVYTASCKDKKLLPERVAIKIVEHNVKDVKTVRTNLRELLYLKKLVHPNIVQLHRCHLVEGKTLW